MMHARPGMSCSRRTRWLSDASCVAAIGAMIFAAFISGSVSAQTLPDYKVHPGDKLIVGVYDDPKLMPQEITVTPDGKIAYPMVGEIVAGGKTTEQIRVELAAKLRKYISDPIPMVLVTDVKGNVVYVIGQVNKPGVITMNPTINVLQALSIAGGGTPYAKLDGIIVIRSSSGGQRILPFRYGQVASGKDLEQNVQLESGDVVVVP
jgi:polysaccharide biosynthesis/export protein